MVQRRARKEIKTALSQYFHVYCVPQSQNLKRLRWAEDLPHLELNRQTFSNSLESGRRFSRYLRYQPQ